jgi:two-component system, OmpR family, alkaline phosphatase synthesis response regulator PhoP
LSEKHTILSWFENKNEEQKLTEYLQKHKYHCISCSSKARFDELLDTSLHTISLVIIDLDIKETDAILACNEVKNRKDITNHPFVVIVSDKAEEFTQVTALDLGADDYIIKPLKPQLFLKRIEAILSRKLTNGNHKSGNNPVDGFFIDLERHLIVIDNETFELPKKEFELMNLFYSVPNKIFSREEIAVVLWNEEKIAKQRTIDVHIRNIRKILGRDLIKTVKGFGYGLNKVST